MAESYIIKRVKKRNGSIVLFEESKIINAVDRAFKAVGKDNPERAGEIAKKVFDILELFFRDNGLPSVESIQDLVERTLILEKEPEAAKAYILYRKQHEELREAKSFALDVQKTMDGYLAKTDWRVAENSNMNYSLSGLLMHLAGSMMAHYTLNKVYPEHIAKAHIDGDFHIHDLSMGIAGYCAGWSLRQLLEEGFNGVSGRTESTPPKHLGSALWQMINFIGTLQNEWAGAQAFSSFDTYLAPFVKADRLSYDEVHHAIQGFVFNMNIPSRWGGQCVSDDTQALTDNGWKFCDEIELKKDKIATFNIATGSIDYLSPSRVKSYPYSGDLIRIANRTQDQLVTPNHRVVRKKFNVKGYALEEAEALMSFKTGILVPNSGITESKKEIAASRVELLAWLVAEGTFSENRKRVAIYQSEKNYSNVRKIRACLKDNGFRWDETKRVHGFGRSPMIRFRLSQESSRKVRETINEKQIPPFIASLSAPQIKLFLETYILGDGHRERKGRVRIYSKDTGVVDALQELCALVGWGTSINIRENRVSQINIIRNQNTLVKLSRAAYHGKVWCPTTENGTFVARRNGTVFVTGNTPFSNITLDWVCPEDMKKKKAVVGGKRKEFSYGECQHEMDMINKAFIEVMARGDAKGRVFTFPIPTYNITRDFDWDSENAKLLFEMTAKYGLPYFQNFINSALNPGDVRSMCCRLQMDMRELRTRGGGLFGSAEMTGSIGVVTLNLPRIGYLSKSKEEFLKRIEKLMDMGRDSLEIKRKLVEHNMEKGLMPFSKRYLGSVHNHFSTIGIVGMNEALQNFFGSEVTTATKEGREFAMEALDFMRSKLAAFQEETKHMYNLEATPAEGTSYRLARIDRKKYADIITAGKGQPYYTNSTQLPVNYTEDVFEALELQDSLQSKYTGGTVLHGFLGEKISDAESCKKLVKRVAENFRLPYFTITPTFSICPTHGYVAGEHFSCPHEIDQPMEAGAVEKEVGIVQPLSK
ncbi:ribonucleoside triphosphate reductase [Candidatus Woesearchaeota archaeon]|nr:ribonucleoside triphosphate reductase [Candidatus Woesearchaeota archaeon]